MNSRASLARGQGKRFSQIGMAFAPHLNLRIKHLSEPPAIVEQEPVARVPREEEIMNLDLSPQAGS
jgi:hypothetical protein